MHRLSRRRGWRRATLFSNRNYFFAGLFADELARSGVRHVVVCPGSRSTPLTMTFASDPRFKCWSLIDERSAAFFALGIGKATGVPAAIVCTSGTAVANLLPAVAEASNLGTPLLLLTADRPPELRDTGANQTIDQLKIFGGAVRWFTEAGVPEVSLETAAYVRSIACRAVATAHRGHPGPVHVNFPFRDPLVPTEVAIDFPEGLDRNRVEVAGRPDGAPYVVESVAIVVADREGLDAVRRQIGASPRGVILAGYIERPPAGLSEAVARLSNATGYPVLAEPSSGLRSGNPLPLGLVPCYDALVRDETFATTHRPGLAIRIGAITTSKVAPGWLDAAGTTQSLVTDSTGAWSDPSHRIAAMLRGDYKAILGALADTATAPDSSWADDWRRASEAVSQAIATLLAGQSALFEGAVAAELARALPDGATLFTAPSMPIRDVETFVPALPQRVRFMANRGANGIDGVTSTALGVAAGGAGPVVLLIGDVAFLHDLSGLFAVRRHEIPVVIVVMNNNGGGIFSFLPQVDYPEHFEEFFTTTPGLDFAAAAGLFGLTHTAIERPGALGPAVREALRGGGAHLVEVRLPSIGHNVSEHRAVWAAVSAALRRAGL